MSDFCMEKNEDPLPGPWHVLSLTDLSMHSQLDKMHTNDIDISSYGQIALC